MLDRAWDRLSKPSSTLTNSLSFLSFFLLALNLSTDMDVPLFGDQPNKRRRAINLGGTHTATTHTDILQEARLRRLQRNDHKRRQDAATLIQRSWRSYLALSSARRSLRSKFDQDVSSLTALRCLVLLGHDEDALGRWSTVILASRKGAHRPSSSSPPSAFLIALHRYPHPVRSQLACTLSKSLHHASSLPLLKLTVRLSTLPSSLRLTIYSGHNSPKPT